MDPIDRYSQKHGYAPSGAEPAGAPATAHGANRGRSSSKTITVLALLLIVVAGLLIYVVVTRKNVSPTGEASRPQEQQPATTRAVTPRADLTDLEKTLIDIYANVSTSVVNVTSLDTRTDAFRLSETDIPLGVGTGFIWDDQGHVVTNFHVIQGGNKARVTLTDKSTYEARVVGAHPDKDIAVLKVLGAPAAKLKKIQIGKSSDLQVGQLVLAVGNPFGLDQSMSRGIISGLGREIKSVSGRPIQDVIQTDAAINRGNSGGPLLDSAGRVIGINTAIYSPTGTSAGIGFAVPVDTANAIVPQLIQHGRVARPGIGIVPLADHIRRRYRPSGVIVQSTVPGGASARAGIQGMQRTARGGLIVRDIIVEIDNTEIASLDGLFRVLDKYKVGDKVRIKVERNGEIRELDIELQDLNQQR